MMNIHCKLPNYTAVTNIVRFPLPAKDDFFRLLCYDHKQKGQKNDL